jgi:ABC-type nitrate/sulfonate/bicarbonate transport system permease component
VTLQAFPEVADHRQTDKHEREGPRAFTHRREAPIVLGTLGFLIALGLWELVTRTGLVPSHQVPPATEIIVQFSGDLTTTAFWSSVGDTLTQWVIGLGLTIVIAVPAGLLMGSVEAVWRAFRPIVEFFRSVPGSTLIPLAILLWGLSLKSVVFLIVFGSIWPLIIQAMYGARDVEEGARSTALAFRLGRLDRARYVVLPSALPYIATGLRIASAIALIIAVSAEILIGVPGLGHDIALAQTAGQVLPMYALILASGIIGIAVHVAFSRLERYFLRWHQSQRAAVRS